MMSDDLPLYVLLTITCVSIMFAVFLFLQTWWMIP